LRQISATHSDLAKSLALLGNSDPSRIPIALQLTNLSALSQQVGVASDATLQRMQAEVSATLAAAQSAADSSPLAAASAEATLAAASAKARQTAQDFLTDFYEKRIFDKDLEFKSEEDRKAYEEREKERQREIQAALAEKTKEGTLRALRLEREQLADAENHGAAKNPEFKGWKEKLDAQVDALEAAQSQSAKAEETVAKPIAPEEKSSAPTFPVDPNIMAALKGAGVSLADQSQQGHGVSKDQSPSVTARLV